MDVSECYVQRLQPDGLRRVACACFSERDGCTIGAVELDGTATQSMAAILIATNTNLVLMARTSAESSGE